MPTHPTLVTNFSARDRRGFTLAPLILTAALVGVLMTLVIGFKLDFEGIKVEQAQHSAAKSERMLRQSILANGLDPNYAGLARPSDAALPDSPYLEIKARSDGVNMQYPGLAQALGGQGVGLTYAEGSPQVDLIAGVMLDTVPAVGEDNYRSRRGDANVATTVDIWSSDIHQTQRDQALKRFTPLSLAYTSEEGSARGVFNPTFSGTLASDAEMVRGDIRVAGFTLGEPIVGHVPTAKYRLRLPTFNYAGRILRADTETDWPVNDIYSLPAQSDNLSEGNPYGTIYYVRVWLDGRDPSDPITNYINLATGADLTGGTVLRRYEVVESLQFDLMQGVWGMEELPRSLEIIAVHPNSLVYGPSEIRVDNFNLVMAPPTPTLSGMLNPDDLEYGMQLLGEYGTGGLAIKPMRQPSDTVYYYGINGQNYPSALRGEGEYPTNDGGPDGSVVTDHISGNSSTDAAYTIFDIPRSLAWQGRSARWQQWTTVAQASYQLPLTLTMGRASGHQWMNFRFHEIFGLIHSNEGTGYDGDTTVYASVTQGFDLSGAGGSVFQGVDGLVFQGFDPRLHLPVRASFTRFAKPPGGGNTNPYEFEFTSPASPWPLRVNEVSSGAIYSGGEFDMEVWPPQGGSAAEALAIGVVPPASVWEGADLVSITWRSAPLNPHFREVMPMFEAAEFNPLVNSDLSPFDANIQAGLMSWDLLWVEPTQMAEPRLGVSSQANDKMAPLIRQSNSESMLAFLYDPVGLQSFTPPALELDWNETILMRDESLVGVNAVRGFHPEATTDSIMFSRVLAKSTRRVNGTGDEIPSPVTDVNFNYGDEPVYFYDGNEIETPPASTSSIQN